MRGRQKCRSLKDQENDSSLCSNLSLHFSFPQLSILLLNSCSGSLLLSYLLTSECFPSFNELIYPTNSPTDPPLLRFTCFVYLTSYVATTPLNAILAKSHWKTRKLISRVCLVKSRKIFKKCVCVPINYSTYTL